MKHSYIGQAWLVILLSLSFGAALAGVQAALKPRIEMNKLNDTISQIPSLVPGATGGKAETVGSMNVFRATNEKGEHVGWVVPARGQGFADIIELLVGVDKDIQHVTGLYILDQKETPGLGNKIVEETWLTQFKGKPLSGPLTVTKTAPRSDLEIQGVTGATISSMSVCGIVNSAIDGFRQALNP